MPTLRAGGGAGDGSTHRESVTRFVPKNSAGDQKHPIATPHPATRRRLWLDERRANLLVRRPARVLTHVVSQRLRAAARRPRPRRPSRPPVATRGAAWTRWTASCRRGACSTGRESWGRRSRRAATAGTSTAPPRRARTRRRSATSTNASSMNMAKNLYARGTTDGVGVGASGE